MKLRLGGRLAIDGQQVVLNDGLHAIQERQGEIALALLYRLRVEFVQRTREHRRGGQLKASSGIASAIAP
jgi:hypothetical protein